MKVVEEKSVGGGPSLVLASIEYRPVAMESFDTVNVRRAFPLVSEVALPRFSMTVFPHIQRKLTDVPAG